MKIKIISADERLKEQYGPKILIAGRTGIGKTSLARTLNPAETLYVHSEHGDLPIRDVPLRAALVESWQEARDFAVGVAGPNPSYSPISNYSSAHFDNVGGWIPELDTIKYIIVDSLTDFGRLSLRHCEQQPENFSRSGQRDIRSAYGQHAREFLAFLQQLQRARGKIVIFLCILERVTDEFNRSEWHLQIEGQKAERELPGILDEIITYQMVPIEDGETIRAFVCTSPNAWNVPAKDRSGLLQQLEPPDLGKLINKLITKQAKEN
jgi:hypothetical protein